MPAILLEMAPKPTRPPREPDIALLIAMIAFAAIATMGELALVVAWPTFWVFVASLVPVLFWAILLREIHFFLRASGDSSD